jgi:hypothetical protein
MSQPAIAAPASPVGLPEHCPTCQGPLTPKLECWRCCDRLCRRCGLTTGSAFIEICWPCWYQTEGREDTAWLLPTEAAH